MLKSYMDGYDLKKILYYTVCSIFVCILILGSIAKFLQNKKYYLWMMLK